MVQIDVTTYSVQNYIIRFKFVQKLFVNKVCFKNRTTILKQQT